MTDSQLRQALETLRQEIDGLENIDAASRHRLDELIASIEHASEQEQDADHHLRLIERFQDEAAVFEASHPQLALALNEIATILSNAGI